MQNTVFPVSQEAAEFAASHKVSAFLQQLTELCRDCELGLNSDGEVFEMEEVDHLLVYCLDKDGKLSLR